MATTTLLFRRSGPFYRVHRDIKTLTLCVTLDKNCHAQHTVAVCQTVNDLRTRRVRPSLSSALLSIHYLTALMRRPLAKKAQQPFIALKQLAGLCHAVGKRDW